MDEFHRLPSRYKLLQSQNVKLGGSIADLEVLEQEAELSHKPRDKFYYLQMS